MALKLAVAAAGSFTAAAGCALVALAQPAASATGTAIMVSAIASRLGAVITIRRDKGRGGSANQGELAEIGS